MSIRKQNTDADSFTAIEHHVRSPIYVLKGYLEALHAGELGELDDKQKKYVKVCLENVNRMSYITDGLVRVMEIDEGRFEVAKECVNIKDSLREVIEQNATLINASNTNVSLPEEEGPVLALTDKRKIKDAIEMLLENAIKYKRQGKGEVEIEIEIREKDILFSIADNGIGVSQEDRDKIFNKFYRTKEAIRVDPNSLGVNLYISKTIIELSGGSIWTEQNDKGGATFFFTLLKGDYTEK